MDSGFDPSRAVSFDSPSEAGDEPRRATTGTVLIVEDERDLACDIIAPHFESQWQTRIAHDLADGLAAVDEIDELCGAIVDLHLPSGNATCSGKPQSVGFDIVKKARRKFPTAPIVIFSGYVNPSYVNTAHRLGAEYLVKGDSVADLQRLACRFMLRSHPQPSRANAFVTCLCNQHALSHRQTQVITLALRGLQNHEIADALGISINTLKRHVAAALDKCSEPSLSSITRRFLRGD